MKAINKAITQVMMLGGVFALWLGLSATVSAEQVIDLYRTETLVLSQQASERNQAAKEALAEIVLRVSGQLASLEHPLVVEAMERAQHYVYEFSYESTDEQLEVDGRLQAATRVVLKFSPQSVEKLLREARLPMWPANRPSVLVWLVVDTLADGRQIAGSPEDLDFLAKAASRRGLKLISPLLDLQDQIALSADDLWLNNEEALRQASQRYSADAILVGRYLQTSQGEWRATWQLQHRQYQEVFDGRADDLQAVFMGGVDQVANYLAGLYAIVPRDDAPDAVLMRLSGVGQFGDYMKALAYLDGLAMVRHAGLVAVGENTLLLRLHTEGDLSLFLSALELDNTLVPWQDGQQVLLPDNRYAPYGSPQNPLQFRWPQ